MVHRTMNVYCFGSGKGHLPARAARIAKRHGATLANYTDPGCSCGRGCARDCKSNRRHWFETANRGEPFNGRTEKEVMDALRAAGIRS